MARNALWALVALLSLSIPLVGLARRANVPYPIVLVVAGLVLGFIPGLPQVTLDPQLVLLIFLPPLLYWEAITAPTDVMRANRGQIWLLALGLVVVTTFAVAAVAHAAIPHIAWAMAFVLGAIVAPTDELASAPVLERMRMPRHLVAVVVGESLLNDASALILYTVAVGATVTGTFDLGGAFMRFAIAAVGGIALGLIVGRLAIEAWRRITDAELQSLISFDIPYLAYLPSDRFALSGVLAVVYMGMYVNRFASRVVTPTARVQVTGFWDTVVFLLNAVLFLMVGLQLRGVVHAVRAEYTWPVMLWYALLVNATILVVRFAWIVGQEYIPPIGPEEHPAPDWRHAIIAGWSGLRGAVSLAAALAIPATIASGGPLPHRNLVIFLTFSVILVTLVGGGLTLPLVVRRLGAAEGPSEDEEDIRRGILAMSDAALDELGAIEREGKVSGDHVERLRRRYEHRRNHVAGHPEGEAPVLDAERRLLGAERRALIELRERGEIDNTALRRLQRLLDVSDERMRGEDR